MAAADILARWTGNKAAPAAPGARIADRLSRYRAEQEQGENKAHNAPGQNETRSLSPAKDSHDSMTRAQEESAGRTNGGGGRGKKEVKRKTSVIFSSSSSQVIPAINHSDFKTRSICFLLTVQAGLGKNDPQDFFENLFTESLKSKGRNTKVV